MLPIQVVISFDLRRLIPTEMETDVCLINKNCN